ncbi:MAG: hypothetical protein E6Q75_02035 [Rheinheimera sp.]|nr:MAG: hypothetical protein E6Q75_02035 [Rheinheimera sp.]
MLKSTFSKKEFSLMKKDGFQVKRIRLLAEPDLSMSTNSETGEVELAIKKSNSEPSELSIIVQPNGLPLEPHNQYLHYRLKEGAKSTSPEANALLSFQNFISAYNKNHNGQPKSYQSLTSDPKEGIVWLYVDYLLDNIKQICPATGQVLKNPSGYSLSTAMTYTDVVISFYKWLHRSGLFFITRDRKPFAIEEVTVRKSEKINQHDILAHTKIRNKVIYVQTTDLKKRFPKVQSSQPHQLLKPMIENHKDIFLDHIKSWPRRGQNKTYSLMYRLAVETGLRVKELVTFPAIGIHHPTSDAESIPFRIGPLNGCRTKFDKQRNISIPYELLLELNEYLHSEQRKKLLTKRVKNLKKQHEKDIRARLKVHYINGGTEDSFETERFEESLHQSQDVQYLFVNASGLPYSDKSLQKKLSTIRSHIQETHPQWYYRMQDLRSTFATHWLKREATRRQMVFDLLLSELADLMGHADTSTTQKYINYMNDRVARLMYASRKNKEAQRALNKN